MHRSLVSTLSVAQLVHFIEHSFSAPFIAKRQPMYALSGEAAQAAEDFIRNHPDQHLDLVDLFIGFSSNECNEWYYMNLLIDNYEPFVKITAEDCQDLFNTDVLTWRLSTFPRDKATPIMIASELEMLISKALGEPATV